MRTFVPMHLMVAPATARLFRFRQQATLPTLRFIDDPTLDLSPRQRDDLRALSLASVCGVVRHTDLADYFQRFGITQAVPAAYRPSWLSKPLKEDSAYLVLGKPYAIERLAGLPYTPTRLSVYDRHLISRALRHPMFADRLRGICEEHSGSVMTSAELRERVGALLTGGAWARIVNRLVYKKLRFLDALYGIALEDIRAELTEGALRAIYKRYPSFHSDAHMLNLAHASARNLGQNLIDSVKAQQREILVNHEGRNRYAILTQGQLQAEAERAGLHMNVYENVAGDDSVVFDRITRIPTARDVSNWETSRTLDVAVASARDARTRRYLSVLRGKQDAGFSAFLGERSDEYADRVPFAVLHRKANSFFEVSDAESAKVLTQVRSLFAEAG